MLSNITSVFVILNGSEGSQIEATAPGGYPDKYGFDKEILRSAQGDNKLIKAIGSL